MRHRISLRMEQNDTIAVVVFDLDMTWLALDSHMDMKTFHPARATLREIIIACDDGKIMRQVIPPAEDITAEAEAMLTVREVT